MSTEASDDVIADDLVRDYVQRALTSKSTGESTQQYDQLVEQLRTLKRMVIAANTTNSPLQDPSAPHQLAALIRALSRCVTCIHERRHEVLLTDILDTCLWSCPIEIRRPILEFMMHAAVAHGALVQTCVHTLVYSLVPPPQAPVPDPSPGEVWQPHPEQAIIQDDVIETAERILELIPTSSTRMLPLLTSNIPHKLRERNIQCLYFRGIFKLAESTAGAGVREGILVAVIEHLISIDVDIRWEQIVDVMTEEAKEEEGGHVPGEEEPDIFELEGMTEYELAMGAGADALMPGGGWEGARARGDDDDGGVGGDHTTSAHHHHDNKHTNGMHNNNSNNTPPPPPPVDETADKLDSLMELTMEHLSRRIASGQLPILWDTFIVSFERLILHTHRSKFTQFLLFYLASHAPQQCCRSFMYLLLSRMMDKAQPQITRSACAAYAASFLARAAFAPEPLVVESLHRLADWLVKYAREEDRRGGLPPIPSSSMLPMMLTSQDARDRHAAFYAGCQAMLYVLCYHMEPLLKNRINGSSNGNGHHHHHPVGDGSGNTNNGVVKSSEVNALGQAINNNDPFHTNNDNTTSTNTNNTNTTTNNNNNMDALAESIQSLFVHALPRLLSHPLDPLSSCARSVVLEFGRQAGSLGHPELMQLVMEWERRHHHTQHSNNKQQQQQQPSSPPSSSIITRPLEVFFPFDPYLLRRSASHLELQKNYVRWRGGHPTASRRRAGMKKGELVEGDSEDDDYAMVGASDDDDDDSSGLGDVSASDDDDDLLGTSVDDDSDSSDSDDSSTSSEDTDDLRRTRFGSMPDSSLSSGGRIHHRGRKLPGALKASLFHGSGGSPTMGMPIPGGSLSTDNGSPWGMSPVNGGGYGSFAPMSMTPGR